MNKLYGPQAPNTRREVLALAAVAQKSHENFVVVRDGGRFVALINDEADEARGHVHTFFCSYAERDTEALWHFIKE